MLGAVNHKTVKNILSKNIYLHHFLCTNAGIFMLPAIVVVFTLVSLPFTNFGLLLFIDIIDSLCNFVSDFFVGTENEIVTYVSESEYAHTTHSRRSGYTVHTNYLVNFRTSSGELLTLSVDSDYLAEVRTYENTEVSYIPRTGMYVL